LEDQLRVLMALGFCLLLLMLRLESEKFGVAEYDEPDATGRHPSLRRRIAWYAVGFGLIIAVDLVHPTSSDTLYLRLGDRMEAILFGLAFAAIGTLQAVAFAWLRYRRLRFPASSSYPGALLNSIGTAFIDEAAFRGILLALLVGSGMDISLANAVQAILYALTTRMAAPGRDLYMLVLILVIGFMSGWLTIVTGGIGAAFLGHSITRFAVFVSTGHPGRVLPRGTDPEDFERRQRLPAGWRVVGTGDAVYGNR
jgi:hypothetical protein